MSTYKLRNKAGSLNQIAAEAADDFCEWHTHVTSRSSQYDLKEAIKSAIRSAREEWDAEEASGIGEQRRANRAAPHKQASKPDDSLGRLCAYCGSHTLRHYSDCIYSVEKAYNVGYVTGARDQHREDVAAVSSVTSEQMLESMSLRSRMVRLFDSLSEWFYQNFFNFSVKGKRQK